MIRRKTVFVLGAGAHCPYRLPDGGELTRRIVSLLPTQSNTNNRSVQLIFELYERQFGSIRETMVEFRRLLEHSGHRTIDSFLLTHANRAGYPEIGKTAVADILLPLEFQSRLSRLARVATGGNPDQDWMSYLFEHMLVGCAGSVDSFIGANDISFVTFNYDRTLEHFFWSRIAHTFSLDSRTAWEHASRIKIIHVYGSLGPFSPARVGARRPDESPSSQLIQESASTIQLMYGDRGQATIDEAKAAILAAGLVCFLGFGFDPDNIERLELNKLSAGKAMVGATRYEVAEGEWTRIASAMNPTQFTFPNVAEPRKLDSLQFLRESTILG